MTARGSAGANRVRRGLLVLVAASALVAILAGLARLGVAVPLGASRVMEHGPLLVLGVFGTVIALERAVALGRDGALVVPALGAAAALATLAGQPAATPPLALASASGLAVVNVAIVRRQAAGFTWLMLFGSMALVAGTLEWQQGAPVFAAVPAWLAFFVLTIAGERLELSRLAPRPRWATPALLVVAIGFGGLAVAAADGGVALQRALGAALLPIALWMARFDLARRTARRPGLPRFSAAGVLAGIAWLVVAAVLLLRWGLPPAGPVYDAIVHAVLVGFVLSMVFAHAPIILPAVARLEVPFHRALYAPLVVLHAGLGARLAGDLLMLPAWRRAGALASAIALALFALAVVWARRVRSGR